MKNQLFLLIAVVLIFTTCDKKDTADRQHTAEAEQLTLHYRMGIDYSEAGQLDKATQAFKTCLAIDANSFDAHFQLARVYLKQQQLDMVADALERAIKIRPDEAKPHLLLAQVFSYQKKFYESSEVLKRVLELNPTDTEARMKLGYFLGAPQEMLVPDLAASKRQFEKVLEINPNHIDAHFQLGLAQFRLGEIDKATEQFEYLVQNYRRHFGASYYLGVLHLRRGNHVAAISNLSGALQIKPRDPEALWNLWTAFSKVGGYPEDLEDELKIKVLQPQIPNPPVKLTNIAAELGVDKVDGGRGSAWGDYDNDGDLDIFAVGAYVPHALYRNNGDGTFTNVATQAGVADPRGGWGSLFADYDNDGDLDLYVTRGGWSGAAENTLYRNNGDSTFADVTKEAGVQDPQSSFCATFGDYDNDGYLDLYIADGVIGDGGANVLYHNNGDGTFTNMALQAGVANRGRSLGVVFGDYDKDGHLDLHLVNFGQSNVLYHNNGDGTFTDVTESTGMKLPITDPFVTFFFDYDNDSDLDIFISNSGSFHAFIACQITGQAPQNSDRQVLYRNNGDGTFTDVTREAGLYKSFGAMGANFGDVDNDGYLDIYLATGAPQMGRLESDALLRNNGDGTFSDMTHLVGVGNIGKGHGVTFGDYDDDGDLDIYVPVGGAFVGDQWPNLFYRNQGNANQWLVIKTVGVKSNRDGIGAKVTVTAGNLKLYAEVSGGCGFGSTNSLPVEFGLGNHAKAEQVKIEWPSGHVDTLLNLNANQIIVTTEGSSP